MRLTQKGDEPMIEWCKCPDADQNPHRVDAHAAMTREPATVCGNCPHSPDMHSPVGTESCAVRDCPCPGLLTTPRSQEALRAALQRLLASADTVHRAGAPRGIWVDFWEAREQARAVLASQPAAEKDGAD